MKFKCKCGTTYDVQSGSFTCECGYTDIFTDVRSTSQKATPVEKIKREISDFKPIINKDIRASQILPPEARGCCGQTSPTFFQKAINLANTMGDFANSGFKVADDELYNQRMEICRGCDRFENNRFCKECGCFMDLKAKIEVAECPLDKWSK